MELTDFELIGTIQIAQALNKKWSGECEGSQEWLEMAGVWPSSPGDQPEWGFKNLNYGDAYRQMAQESNNSWYGDILAKVSRLEVTLQAPVFSVPDSDEWLSGKVIVAPFGYEKLELPVSMWRTVANFLRTYHPDVMQMASEARRIDLTGFPESLVEVRARRQLEAIKNCQLIVGIPNRFTWAAVAWKKPMIILYSKDLEFSKWFPFTGPGQTLRFLQYPTDGLNTAALISGLRHLIETL